MTCADPAGIGAGDVLVLRALGLGDTVVAAAPLRGLRRRFAGHRLIVAAPLALGNWLVRERLVDAVLPTCGLARLPELGGGHIAVNLHGRGPESHAMLEAGHPARLIAFARPERRPASETDEHEVWRADEHEVDRWCRLVRSAGGACDRDDLRLRTWRPADPEAPVLLHPGAASAARRWPIERWREVAAAIAADGASVEVTGSEAEHELAAAIADGIPGVTTHAGRDDVCSLADAVEHAALVISGDTGIAHLATALATPSVTLFGPVPPHQWGAAIDPHLHLTLWHGDSGAATWGDPHGHAIDPRLAEITPDEVIDSASRLLAPTPNTTSHIGGTL